MKLKLATREYGVEVEKEEEVKTFANYINSMTTKAVPTLTLAITAKTTRITITLTKILIIVAASKHAPSKQRINGDYHLFQAKQLLTAPL